MKKALICAVLACVGAFAHAQDDKALLTFLDSFSLKYEQLRIYGEVLPILMTKEQIRTILSSIEKKRETVRKVRKAEYDVLKKIEPDVDEAIGKAEKGQMPDSALMTKLQQLSKNTLATTAAFGDVNAQDVADVVMKTLNKGQLAVMANSVNPTDFHLTSKPEEMKQEEKVKIFVRDVFLNPDAYPLLVKLSM